MKLTNWITLVLVLTLLLAGCGTNEDGPAQGAQEWIDAVTNQDGNRMLKHTCLAQRENLQQAFVWVAAFSTLGEIFTFGAADFKLEGDISDLEFETIDQDRVQAKVKVHGELRVSPAPGVSEAVNVNEEWTMIKENDTWRWCGSSSNEILSDSQAESTASQCSVAVGSSFDETWQRHMDLGCAIVEERSGQMVTQGYSPAIMLWREDQNTIYVFFRDNNTVKVYREIQNFWGVWEEGLRYETPEGKRQPLGAGFGKVWMELGGPDGDLEWPSSYDEGRRYFAVFQDFENGTIIKFDRSSPPFISNPVIFFLPNEDIGQWFSD